MKTTKHIRKLAEQMAAKDQYCSVGFYTNELENLRQALLKGNYYTRVETVAKSGMSRTISIGYIKGGVLHHVFSEAILKLAGCDKNGRIHGCGMDMLFAAQYNLFRRLAPNRRYQDDMKRYREM